MTPVKPRSPWASRSRSPSPSCEAHGLLRVAGDLDEGVRDVLLAVVRQLLAGGAALHDQDGPGAAGVVGLGLARLLDGVHELDLQLVGKGLVVLEPLLAAGEVALALEVGDLHLFLESRDHLLRLVGEAVALALGEVQALRVARGEPVDAAQDAQDHEHGHGGVGAVTRRTAAQERPSPLPTGGRGARGRGHAAAMRYDRRPPGRPRSLRLRPKARRARTTPAGARKSMKRRIFPYALQRWLSSVCWVMKRPKNMKLR